MNFQCPLTASIIHKDLNLSKMMASENNKSHRLNGCQYSQMGNELGGFFISYSSVVWIVGELYTKLFSKIIDHKRELFYNFYNYLLVAVNLVNLKSNLNLGLNFSYNKPVSAFLVIIIIHNLIELLISKFSCPDVILRILIKKI